MRKKLIENADYLNGLIQASLVAFQENEDEAIQDAFIGLTITPVANYYNVEFEYVLKQVTEFGDMQTIPDFYTEETAFTGFKILDTEGARKVYEYVFDIGKELIEAYENLQSC